MSKESSIHIIGGGLYGCLTAYHFAKTYPECQVNLIESSDHLMAAFDPITLDGEEFNNGFHGIELPRAEGLFKFFSNVLKAPFSLQPNNRWMSINGTRVPFDAPLVEWPENLQSFFEEKPPFSSEAIDDFWPLISEEYKELFDKIGLRYSNYSEDVRRFFVPWFFPSDYVLSSNDEGCVFRNQVRSGELKAQYGHPDQHLFSVVQSGMKEALEELGIAIHFSTKVSFKDQKIEYIQPEGSNPLSPETADEIFFCALPPLMLKDVDFEKFKNALENKRRLANALLEIDADTESFSYFSEVLCADDDAPYVSRLSVPTNFGKETKDGKTLIQAELFLSPDEDLEQIETVLLGHILRLLGLDPKTPANLRDLKITRDVFFPREGEVEAANNALKNWVKTYCPNLHIRGNFGPVNMAKTWIWAEENTAMYSKKRNAA